MLGYVFFPVAFVMGPDASLVWNSYVNETLLVSELIGIKTSVNEFVAYRKMAEFIEEEKLSVCTSSLLKTKRPIQPQSDYVG